MAIVGGLYLVGHDVFKADPEKARMAGFWIVIGAVVVASLATCLAKIYTGGRNIW